MALNAKSITIGLPVSDLEKSAIWYEKLFMRDEKLTPVEGVIEYQIGSVWIQLFEEKINVSENVLRLGVEDLDVEFERLKTFGVITDEVIKDVPGIIRYFDFSDPDGNKLSFYWLYDQE
ncbi:VOC family protein [Listeria monocytogenes]|uniref:VOC family protein n=1 Tax=Listeria monocytogenes TaxID=1639 RepID=UPI000E76EBB2|nr:VOC family protein [Listeria monocytogenes]EAC3063108.1 VOC family protein [Listeria monocytogenes]EAC4260827.1 VOC family protein [Listeria monocytogenes]EAE7323089.1 VOC family protein [Listeria monocytogenes]EAW7174517.1 VOC family protein [Listeria monocytogenes]EBD1590246.1 VOC family protein [Listeria monocytogenes]